MPAPDKIARLVEQFDDNLAVYKRPDYKEAQLRVDFLNPLLQALGWDVGNERGLPPTAREVVYEDRVEIKGKPKAPDYGFRLDGRRRFFLEAKKPAVNLAIDPRPALQVRRYAWTAKLPVSILTDFEEFAVYDTRVRPKEGDAPTVARFHAWTYDQYPAVWDDLAAIFHRDAVLGGSLEQYVEAERGKKGVATVDAEFLSQLNEWRDLLARAIANRNPRLSGRDLNFAVQQTLDRIIFLRIAEDRGIEPYGQLRELAKGAGVFDRLIALFVRADARYNSGLFHFGQEKGRGDPDMLTPGLTIDDKPLKDILRALYEPVSPYEFSVFPADILGQVYEQFLGKVIRLTDGGRAKVEEKPEVRKAGGVYYTPTYIVDYIVRQTVGRLVEGHEPDPTGPVSRLRVLDPACGSGSFLLGAYQFLLDWHLRGYLKEPKRWNKKRGTLVAVGENEYALTLAERKRILLDNLYGVDIDPQAVEVTKLSLLLKVLEGTRDELSGQMALLPERALPDLDGNIKCGNSLIGPDFYGGRQTTDHRPQTTDPGKPSGRGPSSVVRRPAVPTQLPMFPADDEMLRVNAFDWRGEFAAIMKVGGFDAVIGNPPYVRSINLKESDPLLWKLYATSYRSASSREWDIYLIFAEKGLSLLKPGGRLGYILPNKFLNSKVGANLRAILAEGNHVERIVHFGAFQIFQNVTTYTCLLFLSQHKQENVAASRYVGPVEKVGPICPMPEESPDLWINAQIKSAQLTEAPWEISASSNGLLVRLREYPTLDTFAVVFQGTGTRADNVFMVQELSSSPDSLRVYSGSLEQELELEWALIKRVLRGRSIGRYYLSDTSMRLIVPYEDQDGKYSLVPQRNFARLAPHTLEYLRLNKARLEGRENGRLKGEKWYSHSYPRSMRRYEMPEKIVIPDVASRGACCLDTERYWLLDTAYGIVLKDDVQIDLRYLLGIINSPLLTYFLKETGTPLRGGYFRMKTAYLNPFPIRPIDFTNPADAARHDEMVALVTRMLELHRKLAAERNPQVKTAIQRQIDATDGQIDRLVYGLYGLTAEEIGIVEGA